MTGADWETVVTILDKIGFLVVVVLVVYLFLKVVVGFLVDQFMGSGTDNDQQVVGSAEPRDFRDDPIEGDRGLHVVSDYEGGHRLVDRRPTERIIRATIRNLDWVDGFHHVIIVTSPGVSLTVSGSLDPGIGLSASYMDRKKEVHKITREPPATVENMEDLLVSFYRGDGRWKQMYVYE